MQVGIFTKFVYLAVVLLVVQLHTVEAHAQTGDVVADAIPNSSQTLVPLHDEDKIIVEQQKEKKKKKRLKDRSATLKRGEQYFAQKKYTKAIKSYDKILDANINDAYVNFRKGLALYNLEAYAEAQPYFERALLVDPNIYRAYSSLSASYILDGKPDAARKVLVRLETWIKDCGLMCFADNEAYLVLENIKRMLKWAELKNM